MENESASSLFCCFTGHRKFNPTDALRRRLDERIRLLYDNGYRYFISGAAMGFDSFAAAAVAALRYQLPELRLWLAIPFEGHDKDWPEGDARVYRHLRELCDRALVLSTGYYSGCYFARDRWMVERSSACVAWFDGSSGGTAYTLGIAAEKGIEIFNLQLPKELSE
jgi:uncharacterized phage-like protein YoqJ